MNSLKIITAIVLIANCTFLLNAQLPDSATQGPNPQDIATPEPEYIDIDGPEPVAAEPMKPVQLRNFLPSPNGGYQQMQQQQQQPQQYQRQHNSQILPTTFHMPLIFPPMSSIARSIAESYATPQRNYQPLILQHQSTGAEQEPLHKFAGHIYSNLVGYKYPAVRRVVYRRRY